MVESTFSLLVKLLFYFAPLCEQTLIDLHPKHRAVLFLGDYHKPEISMLSHTLTKLQIFPESLPHYQPLYLVFNEDI